MYKVTVSHRVIASIAVLLATFGYVFFLVRVQVNALNGSSFNAGSIIDNSVFYNSGSMDTVSVQSFLNAKMPMCDTSGSKIYNATTTRSQYATSKGYPPPYTCLKDYIQTVPSLTNSGSDLCTGSISSGTKSAAQIIVDVSQACGINPQVLIVLLQKEQSLITDDWPWSIQYRSATGYGCPDTAPCDSEFYGYFNQVYQAAKAYKRYQANSTNYNYRANRNNTILFNPNTSCGSSTVFITNQATAGLYIYTPYQPNQAALNNLYGSGDSCSAYGNRNFWRMFSDWFGSPSYQPPACDSRVSGVLCVWQLYNPTHESLFLTVSDKERDSAVINSRFAYDTVPFYAFTTQKNGTVPVYRIKLPTEHFYTSDEAEKNTLVASTQNTYEGVAFYAYPPSLGTNASYPVHRLNGSTGHVFTVSATQKDFLISQGYTYEGVPFNSPSKYADAPDPSSDYLNIYRLGNDSRHFYTTSLLERDSVLRNGWRYEGIMLQSPKGVTALPVYRLSTSADHVFTPDVNEKNELISRGWTYEGIGWYINNITPPTYRFYIRNNHFYTSSISEAFSVSNAGATFESITPGYDASSTAPTYRLFNGLHHFFTVDLNEAMLAGNSGWRYEGIAWYSNPAPNTQPIYRLGVGQQHFYTTSESEKNQLVSGGWRYEGIAWYGNPAPNSKPIYRLLSGNRYFFTDSESEKNQLVSGGWRYEGIAWYSL